MKKKIAACILSAAAFLALSTVSFAAGSSSFIEGCSSSDETLQILCSDIAEEETAEGFTVTLGGSELSVLSVQTEAEAQTPVTYYCLVDVSGSMGEEQMADAKEVLRTVAGGMNAGDNMVIGTLADDTETSGYLTDAEEITAAIEALAAGNQDTNLYKGIVESLEELQSSASVNARACLIILSDGQDDQQTGITQEEAEEAVSDATIPVYTVALINDAQDETAVSYAKLLGSFARKSSGGDYFTPAVDGITAAEAGEAILEDAAAKLVVTVDLTGAEHSGSDETLLRVSYTDADGTEYEDTLYLYTSEIDYPQEEEPDPEPEPAAEDDDTGAAIPSWFMPAVLVIAVLLLLMVLLILRKKRAARPQNGEGEDAGTPEDSETPGGSSAPEEDREHPSDPPAREEPEEELPEDCHEVYLYAVGYSDIVHRIVLEEGKEITIGRNNRADFVLDPQDRRLSGKHCRMKWEEGKLYVVDESSLNGTFVNGVPIQSMGRICLNEGETIRMGSYEYRVGRKKEDTQEN